MNWKQSAKAANKTIEVLEETIKQKDHTLRLNMLDIRDYNKVIADMIAGESPCPMCEDWEECQLNAKAGKGCSEWLLRSRLKAGDLNAEREDSGEAQLPIFGVEEQG